MLLGQKGLIRSCVLIYLSLGKSDLMKYVVTKLFKSSLRRNHMKVGYGQNSECWNMRLL